MADIAKISVSGTQYDIKDETARNKVIAIEDGTKTLTSVTTSGNASVGGTLNVSGTTTLSGNLTVTGDITQSGSSYETHAEQVYTKKDMIITRDGATGGLGNNQYTGIQAKKYDGTNDGQLVFDKDGIARVGDVGQLQALATREDTPSDNYMPYWDAATNKFVTTLPTFNILCGSNADADCVGTIGSLTGYVNGMTVKVLFTNGHYGSTFTLNLDSQGAKPIWVNKDGTPAAMSSNSLDRDGTARNWFVQPYTTLELMYVSSLNSGNGAWLVIGNPVVLSSTASGYTIYADGYWSPDNDWLQYGERDLTKVLHTDTSGVITWLNTNHNAPNIWKRDRVRNGDYVDVSINFGSSTLTHRVCIAYLQSEGYNYSSYNPCIWMTFKNCITTRQMNSTNTNSGGYPATDMRKWLNGGAGSAIDDITVDSSGAYSAIYAAGFRPLTANILENTSNSNAAWSWKKEKVFLPTETMVYGSAHLSLITDAAGSCSDGQPTQLPFYSLKPDNRKKYLVNTNINQWWWLMDPAYACSADRSALFCNSNGNGAAYCHYASNTHGVCPCFIL